jgi:hypothetical protein
MLGCFEAASAFPLPATVTFAQNTLNYLPTGYMIVPSRPTITQTKPYTIPPLSTIHTYSFESIAPSLINRQGLRIDQSASTAWAGANWACIIPFAVGVRTTFNRIFAFNGGTVSGNVDMGIYNYGLQKMFSTGSVAMAGVNSLQVHNLNFTLGPGRYYMALACSNTTATFMRSTVADFFGFAASETVWGSSSFPLPATFTINQFPNYAPLIGIAKGTVI